MPARHVVHGDAIGGYMHFPGSYKTWRSMRDRTMRPDHKDYKHYGGRGITICDRWMTYENFRADMGDRPGDNYSIKRIDNSKGYFPGNCRWALRIEQPRNSRGNRVIEFRGEKKLLVDWAGEIGISAAGLHARLKKWSVEDVITREVKR